MKKVASTVIVWAQPRLLSLHDGTPEVGYDTNVDWNKDFGIHPGDRTLYEHARIIKGFDLVISVDSMPAHLAGALNVPVWLLLQKDADWRWMENINYSPWYPSMKIFRQNEQDNWNPVLEQITGELQSLVQQKGLTSTD